MIYAVYVGECSIDIHNSIYKNNNLYFFNNE